MENVFDYTSKETFDLENRNLFDPFFHFGAHQSELSNFGDFIQINAAEKDILLINDHGIIKAFENSCPHRGCRLIDQQVGNVEKVICPYHGWQFQEGKVFIPSLKDFENAAIEAVTLHYYSVELCGNFIFFSPNPQHSLKEQIGIFWDDLEMMSYSIDQKIDQNPQPFEANWKISLENAIESYHVSKIHAKTLEPLLLDTRDIRYDANNSFLVAPIGNAKITKKLLQSNELFQRKYINNNYFSLYLFPYSMISSTYGYSYAFQTFFPKAPTSTAFINHTYSTRTDYPDLLNGSVAINHKIFIEDAYICALTQQGASTRTEQKDYIYSKNEARIIHFHHSYHKALKC